MFPFKTHQGERCLCWLCKRWNRGPSPCCSHGTEGWDHVWLWNGMPWDIHAAGDVQWPSLHHSKGSEHGWDLAGQERKQGENPLQMLLRACWASAASGWIQPAQLWMANLDWSNGDRKSLLGWISCCSSRLLYPRIPSVLSYQNPLLLSDVSTISTSPHIQIRLHFCGSIIFLHSICHLIDLNSTSFPLDLLDHGCTALRTTALVFSCSSCLLQICKQPQDATWQFSASLGVHDNGYFCGLSHFNICSNAVGIMCNWGGT